MRWFYRSATRLLRRWANADLRQRNDELRHKCIRLRMAYEHALERAVAAERRGREANDGH